MKPKENSPTYADARLDSAGQVSKAKLWIVLRRAYHSLVGFLESGITSRGVALTDFVVLEVLLHKGELTAAEIAKKTHLAPASVEITTANLGEQKLIGLRSHRGKQQSKPSFKLTERGRKLIEWLYEGHVKDIASLFDALSNQQQFDLYQSLRRVGHNAAGRRPMPTTSQKGGLMPWQLSRAVEYIRRNAARPITVSEVAASIEMSDSHFRRAFKIATGLPPYRWLLSVRIGEAQKLLKEGVASLSEIAIVTGFVDQSHFSKAFQKIVGVSPRVWQRDHNLQ
jgi:AraC family transcriptional regulator